MLDEEKKTLEGGCTNRSASIVFLLPTNRRGDLVMDQGIQESLADLKRKASSHLQDLSSQVEDVDSQIKTLSEIKEELNKRIKATEQLLSGVPKLEKDVIAASEPLKVADPETIKQYMGKSGKSLNQVVLPLTAKG
jgi:hypothetical protein